MFQITSIILFTPVFSPLNQFSPRFALKTNERFFQSSLYTYWFCFETYLIADLLQLEVQNLLSINGPNLITQ